MLKRVVRLTFSLKQVHTSPNVVALQYEFKVQRRPPNMSSLSRPSSPGLFRFDQQFAEPLQLEADGLDPCPATLTLLSVTGENKSRILGHHVFNITSLLSQGQSFLRKQISMGVVSKGVVQIKLDSIGERFANPAYEQNLIEPVLLSQEARQRVREAALGLLDQKCDQLAKRTKKIGERLLLLRDHQEDLFRRHGHCLESNLLGCGSQLHREYLLLQKEIALQSVQNQKLGLLSSVLVEAKLKIQEDSGQTSWLGSLMIPLFRLLQTLLGELCEYSASRLQGEAYRAGCRKIMEQSAQREALLQSRILQASQVEDEVRRKQLETAQFLEHSLLQSKALREQLVLLSQQTAQRQAGFNQSLHQIQRQYKRRGSQREAHFKELTKQLEQKLEQSKRVGAELRNERTNLLGQIERAVTDSRAKQTELRELRLKNSKFQGQKSQLLQLQAVRSQLEIKQVSQAKMSETMELIDRAIERMVGSQQCKLQQKMALLEGRFSSLKSQNIRLKMSATDLAQKNKTVQFMASPKKTAVRLRVAVQFQVTVKESVRGQGWEERPQMESLLRKQARLLQQKQTLVDQLLSQNQVQSEAIGRFKAEFAELFRAQQSLKAELERAWRAANSQGDGGKAREDGLRSQLQQLRRQLRLKQFLVRSYEQVI